MTKSQAQEIEYLEAVLALEIALIDQMIADGAPGHWINEGHDRVATLEFKIEQAHRGQRSDSEFARLVAANID